MWESSLLRTCRAGHARTHDSPKSANAQRLGLRLYDNLNGTALRARIAVDCAGQAIPDVHEQSHRLCPEHLGQARLRKCSDDGLKESAVRTLRDAVLRRTVASRVARLYAARHKQPIPQLANKLDTLVVWNWRMRRPV